MTRAELDKVAEMQRALVQAQIMLHKLAIVAPANAASANAVAEQCRKAAAWLCPETPAPVAPPDRQIATRIVSSWAEAVRPVEPKETKKGFDVS